MVRDPEPDLNMCTSPARWFADHQDICCLASPHWQVDMLSLLGKNFISLKSLVPRSRTQH